MENHHKDCRHYLPVDVFKGICKRDKENIAADGEACENFDQIPQCQYCRHFTPSGEFLGHCMGKTEAWPEMIATTCRDFEWEIRKN